MSNNHTSIPVTVHSRDTGISVETFAYIDEGSDAVFCTHQLQNQLGVTGKKTKLEIETLTETTTVDCQILHLEVSDLDRRNVITLPKVYTQAVIPADVGDVVTQQDIAPFPYLKDVHLTEIMHTLDY